MDIDAGEFSAWMTEIGEALQGERATDVPCDGCTACCTSSQFVHVEPDETEALAHIPSALLFPAPGLPRGHVLMGYDERGHCPMLVDGRCTIYAHRPRACRTYDCRVFAATGIELDEPAKAAIAERVARWRFRYDSPASRAEHDALREHARQVDGASATERAVTAVRSRTRD